MLFDLLDDFFLADLLMVWDDYSERNPPSTPEKFFAQDIIFPEKGHGTKTAHSIFTEGAKKLKLTGQDKALAAKLEAYCSDMLPEINTNLYQLPKDSAAKILKAMLHEAKMIDHPMNGILAPQNAAYAALMKGLGDHLEVKGTDKKWHPLTDKTKKELCYSVAFHHADSSDIKLEGTSREKAFAAVYTILGNSKDDYAKAIDYVVEKEKTNSRNTNYMAVGGAMVVGGLVARVFDAPPKPIAGKPPSDKKRGGLSFAGNVLIGLGVLLTGWAALARFGVIQNGPPGFSKG